MRSHALLAQRLQQARAILGSFIAACAWQNRHELVAAVAPNDDLVIEPAATHAGDLLQEPVALLGRGGVVEQLEAVHSHHDDGEWTAVCNAPLDVAFGD